VNATSVSVSVAVAAMSATTLTLTQCRFPFGDASLPSHSHVASLRPLSYLTAASPKAGVTFVEHDQDAAV
jgi:hypothetical protein